jgi:hypothetical protein
LEDVKERDNFVDLGIDGRIVLERDPKRELSNVIHLRVERLAVNNTVMNRRVP